MQWLVILLSTEYIILYVLGVCCLKSLGLDRYARGERD